ncbi:MAG: 5'/3'-nucleotidase SurE [Deltaproteobacteria bacterium]|nr:5'/3'-nucleotidase SurE [Deltaproteobacteria bacterium]
MAGKTLPPRPVVLCTNDDGLHARGLQALVAALTPLAEVYVVAPETEQSASSHAITLARPLRLRPVRERVWALDGTPVDCVYVALHHTSLLPGRPSVVVSGINHGPNLGGDVFYSGTVAGAREGALRGIASVAFSMPSGADPEALAPVAAAMAMALASAPGAPLVNVNFPKGERLGTRVTRLGPRLYEDLVEVRLDPRGRGYLWIGGPKVTNVRTKGTDTAAYEHGLVSVTPLRLDLTEESPATQRRARAVALAGRSSARGEDAVRSGRARKGK